MSEKPTIALVTGANRGIGFEVARQLGEKGMTVFVSARDQEKAEEAVHTLGTFDVHPLALDISDEESVRNAVELLAKNTDHLDVLVNNAGSHFDVHHTASVASLDYVKEGLETNLFGAWRLIQALLPLLKKSEHARIVNVSSQAGSLSDPFMPLGATGLLPAYSVSKAGLNALTLRLAHELKDDHILVNAICPGLTATYPGAEEMGARPVKEGAASIVWGVELPKDGPTGGFYRDGKPLAW